MKISAIEILYHLLPGTSRPLFLFFFAFPILLSAQEKNLSADTELLSKRASTIFFDYRLKRNPTLFLNELNRADTTFTHLYRGQPVVAVQQDSVFSPKEEVKLSKRLYKLDLQIRPYVYSEFGDFRESLRTQIGLAPRLAIGYRGLYGVFQWFFPIQNDFQNRFGFQNRPGELGVGITEIIRGVNFFNAFIGTFTNDRYGSYFEYIRSTENQRIYMGSSLYYTGRILYDEGIIFRERINYLSGEIFALYRFKQPNLSIRVSGERFLREDTGVTVELMRQFGNTDIGFSVTDSDNGTNARMFVAFSIGGKFYSNKWFQVRPPHTFRFDYDLQPNTGISERTRPFSNFFYDIYRFNLPYVQSQL